MAEQDKPANRWSYRSEREENFKGEKSNSIGPSFSSRHSKETIRQRSRKPCDIDKKVTPGNVKNPKLATNKGLKCFESSAYLKKGTMQNILESFDPYHVHEKKFDDKISNWNSSINGQENCKNSQRAHLRSTMLTFSSASLFDMESRGCTSEEGRPRQTIADGNSFSPGRSKNNLKSTTRPRTVDNFLELELEPLRTSSGLLLTHRKSPAYPMKDDGQIISAPPKAEICSFGLDEDTYNSPSKRTMNDCTNSEAACVGKGSGDSFAYPSTGGPKLNRRKCSSYYLRLWLAGSFVIVVFIFGVSSLVKIRSMKQNKASTGVNTANGRNRNRVAVAVNMNEEEEVVQVDLKDKETKHENGHAHLLEEFTNWIEHHEKIYESKEEHEKRFKIWTDNHHRTVEKNLKHGPCKLTKEPVFGSNHFKDVHPDEFKEKYLTGYNGPKSNPLKKAENSNRRVQRSDEVGGDRIEALHPSLQKTYINSWGTSHTGNSQNQDCQKSSGNGNKYIESWSEYKKCYQSQSSSYQSTWTSHERTSSSSSNLSDCSYMNWSCWLQWLFDSTPYTGSGNASFEDIPDSMDWRKVGAVSSVHSQGNCGACWAITAVETVESAYFLSTGTLVELAEEEVIVCEDSCNMCYGGWPQNAYEYIIEKGGLQSESSMTYDGDWLLALTMVKSGESDEVTEEYVESYMDSVCPSDNDGTTRYGEIKSYAYATNRCVCYTNGSGCDCEEQDEATALANIAAYGPATVCLEASTWQDYAGGIITADSGCSASFLDMNHCVQAVGFAFYDTDGDDDAESGSGSEDSASKEGYWIIRNQWSSYWGINGYAYVAIGGDNVNTCGVLNDMTQVFMD